MNYLNSQELFQELVLKYPSTEFFFFSWRGGGDDFAGFKLLLSKVDGVIIEKHPAELAEVLEEKLLNSTIFDDLSIELKCVHLGSCTGVLLIALKPLTDYFLHELAHPDPYISIEEGDGFKGISVSGANREDILASREF